MKRFLLAAAAAVVLLLGGGARLSAQVQAIAIGPKLGFGLDKGTILIGAIAEFPITANLDLEPGIEYLPNAGEDITRLAGDFNARYTFVLQGLTVRPYALAGIGLSRDFYSSSRFVGVESQTEFRINYGGGVVFNTRSSIQPWVGLKGFILSDNTDIFVLGGVNFYIF